MINRRKFLEGVSALSLAALSKSHAITAEGLAIHDAEDQAAVPTRSRVIEHVLFSRRFAPSEGMVSELEKPYRAEICLNGSWEFQPVAVPSDYKRSTGIPPTLNLPDPHRWEEVKIKVPSPWNVNTWGNGRDVGEGTARPYVADSVYYPSYPAAWDSVEMGWLRRFVTVPENWRGRRIVLHFEAVAGEAQIFINGEQAGSHFDTFLPFDFDITSLVKNDQPNEVLVGVRKSNLFNIRTPDYPPTQQRTYPNGSNTDNLVGIWNDVYLWGLPAIRIEDVFIQPQVDEGIVRIEIAIRNDGDAPEAVTIDGDISPWRNLAGSDVLSAPEPKWKLDQPVLRVEPVSATATGSGITRVVVECKVNGELEQWTPETPHLYGLVLRVHCNGQQADSKYTRFGWRQFGIRGRDLLLNGKPIQLTADFCHPFGPFIGSRRYVWMDMTMIKEMGGNALRPHANIMPRFWLDMADEMGICVLDESAIFGSSISLNLREPITWERFRRHVDGLVQRDRNHPCIFGWSVANEMFALSLHTDKADHDMTYDLLRELSKRTKPLDPTRDWVSMDGDEDLDGALPVWSKHIGIGLPEHLPADGKPLMIGEHGGTYYAGPRRMRSIGGDIAYESYSGRNVALAFDLYRMVTTVARPKLAYFSESELAWFGLEQLPFGYRTDKRPPNRSDGVFFSEFVENVPGVQIERLPPYVATFNPGFDSELPHYKPLAMFEAMKTALTAGGGTLNPWQTMPVAPPKTDLSTFAPKVSKKVLFLGDRGSGLFESLEMLGVPFVSTEQSSSASVLIVDGEANLDSQRVESVVREFLRRGDLVWIMFREEGRGLPALSKILPAPVSLTSRQATSLIPSKDKGSLVGFDLDDLYFADATGDPRIQAAGLAGPLVDRARVLLTACNSDWSLFEDHPEIAKCGSMLIYEHLQKPAGAALIEVSKGSGKLWVSTLLPHSGTEAFRNFWAKLWANAGVNLLAEHKSWLVPPGRDERTVWRYTTMTPPDSWAQTGFTGVGWRSGNAPFGSPSAKTNADTKWDGSDLFMRKEFAVENVNQPLSLIITHSAQVDVYLNGVLIFSEQGSTPDYKTISLAADAKGALKSGMNVLAAHSRGEGGEPLIDIGLQAGGIETEPKRGDRGLMMEGPK
jgi:beta-galactosidase